MSWKVRRDQAIALAYCFMMIGSASVNDQERTQIASYRPEIDGLRALAVVAVIIFHFNKDMLPNGYLGVDVFL